MGTGDSAEYPMGHHEPLALLVHVQALAFKSCKTPAFPETQQRCSFLCNGTFFPVLHLPPLAHLSKRQELQEASLTSSTLLHIFIVPSLFTFIFDVNPIIFYCASADLSLPPS